MRQTLFNNRLAIISTLVLVTLMLVTLIVASWKTNSLSLAFDRAKKQFDLSRSHLYAEIDDADFLVTNITEYERLQQRGVIGAADQIIWIAALENVKESLALTDISYQIGEPNRLAGAAYGQAELRTVIIDLRIGFPHDDALFLFFQLLSENLELSYAVTELDISRVTGDYPILNAETELPINLIANCQLTWYSILPVQAIGQGPEA